MVSRKDVVRYLVNEYYGNDVGKAAKATQFTKQQIGNWMKKGGHHEPQKRNVGKLMYRTFAPGFTVITEYKPLDASGQAKIHAQLRAMLKGHEKASGIYAFYDSMANLVYLGKTKHNLLAECYQQLGKAVQTHVFPKGAKQPKKRTDVVRYVSAYCVRDTEFEDYAKHVESLILRISKPILNTNIGKLQKAI